MRERLECRSGARKDIVLMIAIAEWGDGVVVGEKRER